VAQFLLICCCVTSVTHIAYLECDPGQTEFTPPGCLSLHLVYEPVLGRYTIVIGLHALCQFLQSSYGFSVKSCFSLTYFWEMGNTFLCDEL